MYLEVTRPLPADAASHYSAIRTALFARTPRSERVGGGEITIKGLCGGGSSSSGGPTAEAVGGVYFFGDGRVPGVP